VIPGRIARIALVVALTLTSCGSPPTPSANGLPAFTDDELAMLRSLWIGGLPPLPVDPSNRFADDPGAARLGEAIFFDTRFSANGSVSCASCHRPELAFTDGLPRGQGIAEVPRNTMPLAGAGYATWLFWDGRRDSLWAQALGPLENAGEHGGNRTMYAHVVAAQYRTLYESVFGPLPDLGGLPASAGPVEDADASAAWQAMRAVDRAAVTRVYVNIGKALEAYERSLQPQASRFDTFVEALLAADPAATTALTPQEVDGLRLFIGSAQCTNCHNGPLLTNGSFHNTGVPPVVGRRPDPGRAQGIGQVQADEFNCLSRWSDAEPDACRALRFLRDDTNAFLGAFKPPSLRDVAATAPYMHAGQLATLEDVVRHYGGAPEAAIGHSELQPLALSDAQVDELVAFLEALSPR
jgi:cytochrome c peroxidase